MAGSENFPSADVKRGRSGLGLLGLAAPLFLLVACSTEAPPAADPIDAPPIAPAVVASSGDFRLETEPVVGARFPVLATGITVDVRHFDASLPTIKFRHSIRLVAPQGTVVLIDVWDNPQRLALQPWFDATLGFLVDSTTKVSQRLMTTGHLPGILLEQPASPQAGSQAIAVFASGTQVFRVTCIDPEGDAVAKRLFDRVVDQIELGVTR
jgi:hypothetical protein